MPSPSITTEVWRKAQQAPNPNEAISPIKAARPILLAPWMDCGRPPTTPISPMPQYATKSAPSAPPRPRYCKAVGDGEPPYAEFRTGTTILALYDRAPMAKSVKGPMGSSTARSGGDLVLSFKVEHVGKEFERLKAAGAPVDEKPTDRPAWIFGTAHVRDPDGYLVEIYTYFPSAWEE